MCFFFNSVDSLCGGRHHQCESELYSQFLKLIDIYHSLFFYSWQQLQCCRMLWEITQVPIKNPWFKLTSMDSSTHGMPYQKNEYTLKFDLTWMLISVQVLSKQGNNCKISTQVHVFSLSTKLKCYKVNVDACRCAIYIFFTFLTWHWVDKDLMFQQRTRACYKQDLLLPISQLVDISRLQCGSSRGWHPHTFKKRLALSSRLSMECIQCRGID